MSNNKVSLADISKVAGVSTAAVSIILNHPWDNRFSEKTNTTVIDIADELGYPYIKAGDRKNRKDKKIPIVGLVIPDLTNPYYPEIASSFSRLANELGYQVILFDVNNDFGKETEFIQTLINMKVSGVGFCGVAGEETGVEQKLLKKLKDVNIPVVQIDRYDSESICPYVGIDNYQAAYGMTEKLIQAGHKKIAVLAQKGNVYIIQERRNGYIKAMQDYDLEPVVYSYSPTQYGDLYQQFYNITHSGEKYTAVFAVNGDIDAIECIRAAEKVGVKIPTDISIAGVDGILLAEVINPALSTIVQPRIAIGERAMQLLYKLINDDQTPKQNVILPFEYVMRESTRNILNE